MKKDTRKKRNQIAFEHSYVGIGKIYPQVVPLGMSHFHFIGPVDFLKKIEKHLNKIFSLKFFDEYIY